MSEAFTYEQLHEFLRGLGFEHHTIPDSHEAFMHSLPDTFIMLTLHDPDDEVLPHDVIKVRSMTVERGLIEPEEFDQVFVKVRRMSAS